MKKKIIVMLILVTFILTGCGNQKPNDVFNAIKRFMSDEFTVELVDYEVRNDGMENSYTYHLKTKDFDFYAKSHEDPTSINGSSEIYTNLSAIIYHNNINKITEIANKYELKVEEKNNNVDYYSVDYEYYLIITANKSQEENVSKFAQELLQISDIQKLVNLRYDKYIDENGQEQRSFSFYHEHMIRDYSKIEIYDGTEIVERTSILLKSIG